jgi:amino acid adenylation domain-containing protein
MLLHGRERVGAELQQLVIVLPDGALAWTVRRGFERAYRRHASLRTTFSLEGDAFTATVHPPDESIERAVPWIEHDVALPWSEAAAQVLARDRATPLDVSHAPVFRLTCVRCVDCVVVVWTFHHAHLDGRSIELVLDDVVASPEALEEPSPDPDLHVEAALATERLQAGRALLADALAELREATPSPMPPARGVAGPREAHAVVPAESLRQLAALGERFGFTWATVMHAAWALVLAQLANRAQVVFGSTRACRNVAPTSRDTVGCLINTVPFFVACDPRERVIEMLARLRDRSVELRDAETLSLDDAAAVCALRTASDLVRTILVCEGHTLETRMHATHPQCATWSFTLHGQSGAPITVAVYRRADGGADVVVEVDPTVLDVRAAGPLAERFVAWVEELARSPYARLDELSAPGRPAELRGGPAVSPVAMGAALLDACDLHAERVALKSASDGEAVTYRDLRARAEGLAAALHAEGARPGDAVAVCARRDLDTIVALLAAFVGGFVYVPVDPRHPEERRRLLLSDSGARYWIARPGDEDASPARTVRPRALRRRFELAPIAPEAAAYLLYTSGSTGIPKGVRVPHRALHAHARAAIDTYALTRDDRVLQFASPSFDVYLEEVVPTLLAGGAVIVRDDAAADSFDALLATIARERITVLQLPTALFHELGVELARRGHSLPRSVRLVVIGGERASASACRRFRGVEPSLRLVNAYGPTEVTITSVVYDVPKVVPDPVPIGRPFGACDAFVADWRGRIASVGVRGELVLAGPQVALGYHERPEPTAAKFVPDPRLPADAPERGTVYRTGDVVFVDDEGQLVFEGRVDDQVKVRGFRIELGEIEHALLRDPSVAEAVATVVSAPDVEAFLAAFVVLSSPDRTTDDLRKRLAEVLPRASVPARIVIVPRLPRTVGGKVDRGALVAHDLTRVARDAPTDLARASELERHVAAVFSGVLGAPVDLDDDFFDLGGSSLRALAVVSRLSAELPAKTSGDTAARTAPTVATLVAHPTPRALALWLATADAAERRDDEIVRLNQVPDGPTPLFGVVGLHLYSTIARAMSRPVFGVFLPDEVAFPERKLRIPSLADSYLRAIETRGAPPKLLAGFSFGAIVAFEMAQQLHARGVGPDLVVMLDPRLPSMLERKAIDPLLDLVAVARRDRREGAAHLMGLVSQKLRQVRERVVETVARDAHEPTDEQRARSRDSAYAEALEIYEPSIRAYPGRALIYLARDESPGRLREVEATWRRLVAPGSLVEVVPGTHGVLLTEPFVQKINVPLTRLLRRRPSVQMTTVGDDDA